MNRMRNCVLALGAVAFVGSMVLGALILPERVASHFGLYGQANGWMRKEADLLFLGGVGIGLPLFIVGLTYVTRFFPDSMFNLPHKEYWLAPERRQQTVNFIFQHSLWMAGLMQLFLSWVNFLTIMANKGPSARLPMAAFVIGFVAFLIATGLWMAGLIRHFYRPA